jgi:hypothetical protein
LSSIPSFPALAFRRDVGRFAMPGRERLTWFLDAEDFSTCTAWALRRGERLGMTLVDRAGHCWTVLGVTDCGVVGSFMEKTWRFLVRQSVHRVEQQTIEVEAQALERVKDRVILAIRSNPDDWRDDEAIAGEAGPPRDEADLLDELEAAVRSASSVSQIIDVLYQEN